jgi:hypothetical protein
MTTLWKISNEKLSRLEPTSLAKEQRLEDWIAADPTVLGLDVILIGRQVQTGYGGRNDLLAMDREGYLTIIELKRNGTPREIVAQILDYASWVRQISAKEVQDLATSYRGKSLSILFREYFDAPLPEQLNSDHNLIIVAGSLDLSSQRIVEYLAQSGISINTALFNFFDDEGQEYLTADWLMDQQEVQDRSESKTKIPWTGVWYANVGDGTHRSWKDMRKFGFLSAGNGSAYSGKLNQLAVDEIVSSARDQAASAATTYPQYGKGTGHAAGLNFGDCFSYALAKLRNEPLLFKGDDFLRTDLKVAVAR